MNFRQNPEQGAPDNQIAFYLPGMFSVGGHQGRHAALSITGDQCTLMCDHCRGKILSSMLTGDHPDALLERCLALDRKGYHGVLLSGGCDADGRLPWQRFYDTIARIKTRTALHVSVHCGLATDDQARSLKDAGVDQALIDVVGSDDTFQRIYHLDSGRARITKSLTALEKAGLPIIAHIVCGIDFGRIIGEKQAVAMISDFQVQQVVIVGLMKLAGVPASRSVPPTAEAIADIIADCRRRLPGIPVSLGCARERGNIRLETLAIDAGVTRMALPSEEAVAYARRLSLQIVYQRTCCSLAPDRLSAGWLDES
jgi:lipoyl synthase